MSPYKMSKIEAPIRCALSFIDFINNKDNNLIASKLCKECLFSNFNHCNDSITGYDNILIYFSNFFTKNPNQLITITDTYNYLNKAIIKFNWSNVTQNKDNTCKCVGIFDVHKECITSIDIYCKM